MIRAGDQIIFTPRKGKKRRGEVLSVGRTKATVLLEGDPFGVEVEKIQIESCNGNKNVVSSNRKVPKTAKKETDSMTAATKPSAKELRKQAQALGIEGWEDMGRDELAKAIKQQSGKPAAKRKAKAAPKSKPTEKPARKAKPAAATKPKAKATKAAAKPKSTKSAAAAKKGATKAKAAVVKGGEADLGLSFAKGATPKPLPEDGENPFRKSSNLYVIANLLLKGGVRRTLAQKLSEKVELHPYHKESSEIDLDDYDKRLVLGAQTMRDQFGYGIQRIGRGIDGKILVFRPGGPKDPRNAPAPKRKAKAKK